MILKLLSLYKPIHALSTDLSGLQWSRSPPLSVKLSSAALFEEVDIRSLEIRPTHKSLYYRAEGRAPVSRNYWGAMPCRSESLFSTQVHNLRKKPSPYLNPPGILYIRMPLLEHSAKLEGGVQMLSYVAPSPQDPYQTICQSIAAVGFASQNPSHLQVTLFVYVYMILWQHNAWAPWGYIPLLCCPAAMLCLHKKTCNTLEAAIEIIRTPQATYAIFLRMGQILWIPTHSKPPNWKTHNLATR